MIDEADGIEIGMRVVRTDGSQPHGACGSVVGFRDPSEHEKCVRVKRATGLSWEKPRKLREL